MDLRPDRTAEPQSRPMLRKQGHRIMLNEVRQMGPEREHLDRDDWCMGTTDLTFYAVERFRDAALARGECEFPKIRAVAESSVSAGRSLHDRGGDAAVHGFEVLVERRSRASAGRECRPMLN